MSSPYDEIPYPKMSFPQTRPDRLRTVAKLFGLEGSPASNSRVLELGCARGANLIPLAQQYPQSRFVGIDASAKQIADGWETINAAGLKNIDLRHANILELDNDLGEFDYIICHGVFSWVPPNVQNKILSICRNNLSPQGIAYISYNTYPGWHIRGIVRDMMHFHGAKFGDPNTRLSQAKAMVEFIVNSSSKDPYQNLLKSELDFVLKSKDSYLHHEFLAENNQPMYFHEFAHKLSVSGLQYLGDSDFSTMVHTNFAPEVAEVLQRLGAHDIVQMEQHMDFVRARYFRQSLICQSGVTLNRLLGPDSIKGFRFTSTAAPVNASPNLAADVVEEFRTPGGKGLNCKHPVTKSAFLALRNSLPKSLSFSELFAESQKLAKENGHTAVEENLESFFAGELLTAYAAGTLECQAEDDSFTTIIAAKPVTTSLARVQAKQGDNVTNLRGEDLTVDEIHRQILMLLDGKNDNKAIIDKLIAFVKSGNHKLRSTPDDKPITTDKEMRKVLAPTIDQALQNFARLALLLPS